MGHNSDKNSFYNLYIKVGQGARRILLLSVFYCIVGSILISIPFTSKLNKDSKLTDLLSNIGISFITASIVTLTIDWRSRQQSENETNASIQAIENVASQKISKIVEASEDAMLSLLIQNKTIFKQLRESVIRQEFIIKNYRAEMDLEWTNAEKKFLYQKAIITYDVENLTQEEKDFALGFGLENRMFGIADEIHEITECKFCYINTHIQEDILSDKVKENFERQKQLKSKYLEVTEKVRVQPGCYTRIRICFKTTLREMYSQSWVVSRIADGMEIVVYHPKDLFVEASPLHPVARYTEEAKRNVFITPDDDNLLKGNTGKTWKINTGILPFQGIDLSWKKV